MHLQKWQQENSQSLNSGQSHSLRNSAPFVTGGLRNYLLCKAEQSHSNASLVGPWGKSTSRIKLGSNVWTTYSNSDHLAWSDEKILSPHAVLERGKRRATGGCQLREREGHHPLKEEQHDCLWLSGLHGDQPSTSRRKEELNALQRFAVAWQVSAAGSQRESVLHQTRTANISHKHLTHVLLSVLYYTNITKYRRRKEAAVSEEAGAEEGKCLGRRTQNSKKFGTLTAFWKLFFILDA